MEKFSSQSQMSKVTKELGLLFVINVMTKLFQLEQEIIHI